VIKKTTGFFVFLLFLAFPLFSQYYSTGQDPASVRWRHIKTEKYNLIYPRHFEEKAQYLANILDLVTKYETKTLVSKVPRIPVILHTESAYSNGLTIWAPRRIELFPCPPQSIYPEEWLEQLAIHEYRHAVQISKMNKGFTKALYYGFGEQATASILGLFIPAWFLEGDATATETALSYTGRGRLNSFIAPLRAQLLEKRIYSYDKATMGSFKTFTPDHYVLGYHLVAMGRTHYGAELWNNAMDRSAKLPFMIVPFAYSIKKNTSFTKTKFYRNTLQELDSMWRKQYGSITYTPFKTITIPDPRNYSLYDHPLHINDSTIIAGKESNEDPDFFVIVSKDGTEKRIFTPGNYQSGSNSYGNGLLTWAEYVPDIRWSNRNYSVIRTYDLKTKKIRDLTRKTRFFSPILSPDGKSIAAVEITRENKFSIVILDSRSGEIKKRIKSVAGEVILTPAWSPDEKRIIYLILDKWGKTIVCYDLTSDLRTTYMPAYYNDLAGPAYLFGQYIMFSANYSGIDNLYVLDTLSGKILQVTSVPFLAFDPDPTSDKKKFIFSNYCSDGMMIAEADIDTTKWVVIDSVKNSFIPVYDSIVAQESINIQDSALNRSLYKLLQKDTIDPEADKITREIHPWKRYSKAANLFNFHSWAPVSLNTSNLTIHPGVMVLSQNLLSTSFTQAGYDYNINEGTGKFYAGFTYEGWFPVVNFRYEYGKRAGLKLNPHTGETSGFTWNESALSVKINVPLDLSHGRWYRNLNFTAGSTLIDVIHDKSTPPTFTSGWITSMDYRIYASNNFRSNFQDMFPKWGQSIDFNFRHSPFSENDIGSIFAGEMNLYFPGILRHHGIWIYCGYQKQNDLNVYGYSYPGYVIYPRGDEVLSDGEVWSVLSNYKFPLFCPDWSIGSLVYIKRFKLNLFFDYAEGFDPGSLNIYKSTGTELTADLHLLRFAYPFELGVRAYYLPDDYLWGFNFLWGISF
jgi:hypothetical protein